MTLASYIELYTSEEPSFVHKMSALDIPVTADVFYGHWTVQMTANNH